MCHRHNSGARSSREREARLPSSRPRSPLPFRDPRSQGELRMFVHVVLFWMKEDAASGAREQLKRDCEQLLAKIPGARQCWAGHPAMTPREVVDNSYDV